MTSMVVAVPATVWSEELEKNRVDRIPIYYYLFLNYYLFFISSYFFES